MTTRLHIDPEAEAELEEAADRYEESVPGLGLEFLAEMRKRTRDVLGEPYQFPRFGRVEGVGARMPLADFHILSSTG
jgi:hypothetical protein